MTNRTGSDKPRKSGRFPKGESGNLKGRPRKRQDQKSASAFGILDDQSLTIARDGVPQEVTAEEALQHKIYQDAIRGDRAACREVLKMINKREKAIALKEKREPESIKLLKEPTDPDNANEAIEILEIASLDEEWLAPDEVPFRLLLENWAVQMALSRRRGGHRLESQEVEDIKRCTRDPDALKWPRSSSDE